MAKPPAELLPGTLHMLILKTLAIEPMHGWGIAQRIQQMSGEVFEVNQGSLYPALQRLKRKGWVDSKWKVTENGRRARYYELSKKGERQLDVERAHWRRQVRAVDRILRWAY